MFEGAFNVKYVNFKTSFVYVSPAHNGLHTGSYVRLVYHDQESSVQKTAFFSVTVLNSLELEEIGINSICAKALDIADRKFVHVTLIEHLPVVNSLSIIPKNQSDYEVLEILAQNVQSSLLDQVSVVNCEQPLTIWIGNSISVTVFVDDVRPVSPGVIDFLTEMRIKNPNDVNSLSTSAAVSKRPKMENANSGAFDRNFINFIKSRPQKTNMQDILTFVYSNEGFPFRVVPLYEPLHLDREKLIKIDYHPSVIVMWKTRDYFEDGTFCLTPLASTHSRQKIYVNVLFVKDFEKTNRHTGTGENQNDLIVPVWILKALDIDYGSRVVLTKVTEAKPVVSEIKIHTTKQNLHDIVATFKAYIGKRIERKPFLLNAKLPFEIAENVCVSLEFLPHLNEFCHIHQEMLNTCKFSTVESSMMQPLIFEKLCTLVESEIDSETIISPFLCIKLLMTNAFSHNSTIIVGKMGMGKSRILNLLSKLFPIQAKYYYRETIQCKSLKGKTVESLQKIFSDVAQKLVARQPSALFLDDLQVLCEHCEGDEAPNAVYFNRVSEMLFNLFTQLIKNNDIVILATVDSINKLNKQICKSRGNHFFKKIVNLEGLNKNDRQSLLKYYFKKRQTENLDFADLATKTDGFVIQDIVDFYIRALFEAHKQEKNPEKIPVVTAEHCEVALKKSTPLALQNVKFSDVRYKPFADIGGLEHVKSVLIESLMWPSKYSQIFSGCPLRVQSGILLYGAPGTGKTILAGAAAKFCGLRLISVKGPELLSKYIGASEQAVRDVFERAQNAKPCILFFDEFDSLAPRRGHDNTGVTDRVVNQILTHLDGIEALTDVFVIAATSRPDLLDPALLRPGRLDRQLLCTIPDTAEREEILKILTKGLDLDEDVNFQFLAQTSIGFTGADLQSAVYTAQMSIVTDMEVDVNAMRDEKLEMMKSRFCPGTPKHFLSERAKKQLLEQTNSEILNYNGKLGLNIFVILENQEMKMVHVQIPRPVEIRDFLRAINVEFEPDSRIEIYDFNNWDYNEPHFAVFVGNCNPDLNLEKIDMECLTYAIKRTRNSLSNTERMRYLSIYQQFQKGKQEDLVTGSKITLA